MIEEIDIRMSDKLYGLKDCKSVQIQYYPIKVNVVETPALMEIPIMKFRTNSYVQIYKTIHELVEEHGVTRIYYQLRPTQLYANVPHAQAVCQAYFIVSGEVVY